MVNRIKGEDEGEDVAGDSDGDGLRDGSWQAKMKRKKDALKAKIPNFKRNKKDDDDEDEDDSSSGLWGILAGALGGLATSITDGFGSISGILGSVKDFLLGGSLTKSLAGLFGGGGVDVDLPSKKKGPGLLKRGMQGLWNLGKGAVKMAGRALPALAMGAGKGLLAAGTAIASSPVLAVAAVGGIAYGGYKAYKYFDNRSEATGIEKMRFLQYGANVADPESRSNIRYLESEIMDDISWSKNTPKLKISVKEATEEYAEEFGVSTQSSQEMHEWATWFAKRFIPVMFTHLTTAKAMGISDDITDIHSDIKDDQKEGFIKRAIVPKNYGKTSPFAVRANPWPAKPFTDTEAMLDSLLSAELGTEPVAELSKDPELAKAAKVNKELDKERAKAAEPTKVPNSNIVMGGGSEFDVASESAPRAAANTVGQERAGRIMSDLMDSNMKASMQRERAITLHSKTLEAILDIRMMLEERDSAPNVVETKSSPTPKPVARPKREVLDVPISNKRTAN